MAETLADFLLARIAEHEAQYGDPRIVQLGPLERHVLAECEAQRALTLELGRMERDEVGWDGIEAKVMGYLALPYADHPEYRQEWRP